MNISEKAQRATMMLFEVGVPISKWEEIIQKACEDYARDLSDYKAKELAAKDAEIARMKRLLPDPREGSGWDDPACPVEVAVYLHEVAKVLGIEMPEHIKLANEDYAREGGEG